MTLPIPRGMTLKIYDVRDLYIPDKGSGQLMICLDTWPGFPLDRLPAELKKQVLEALHQIEQRLATMDMLETEVKLRTAGSWSEGTLLALRSGKLVAIQTDEIQQEVSWILDEIRMSLGLSPKWHSIPQGMAVVVYDLKGHIADLRIRRGSPMEALPDDVRNRVDAEARKLDPKTDGDWAVTKIKDTTGDIWNTNAQIFTRASKIIVVQTPEVQAKIVTLLQTLGMTPKTEQKEGKSISVVSDADGASDAVKDAQGKTDEKSAAQSTRVSDATNK